MIGPAATYGAAVPAASQAAGVDPRQTYDAITPSLAESATLGAMTASHTQGLRSGGLVGYSTFFTGYDPDRDGTARRLSMGRGAAQAVSASARALMHTGLQNTAAGKYIEPFTMAHRYGVGGAMDAAMRGPMGSASSGGITTMGRSAGKTGTQTAGLGAFGKNPTLTATQKGVGGVPTSGGPAGTVNTRTVTRPAPEYENIPTSGGPVRQRTGRNVNPLRGVSADEATLHATSNTGTKSRSAMVRSASADDLVFEAIDDPKDKGFIRKALTGILGGMGYDDEGRAVGNLTREQFDSGRVFGMESAAKGSGGAQFGGAAGRVLGKGVRFLGAFEIARLGVDAATYAMGEGYEAMVKTTERLQRRVGADHSMSGGYYNRAAATERQRAVQTLNSNRLNPRTQIRGNEAYYNHR